jgi:hypothetical protein
MLIVQCKEPEGDWYEMENPHTFDWTTLKHFASKWGISIRLVNEKTKVVEREFHPT